MPKRTVPKKTDCPGQEPTFEEALRRLEEIVTQLEGGDAPLDSALKLYEEGVSLARSCSRQLKEAERRVELLEDKDGELKARPLPDQAGLETEDAGGLEDENYEDEDQDGDDRQDQEAEAEETGSPADNQAGPARKGGRKAQDTLF